MFLPDNIPIICNLPKDLEFADIYFLHDIHFGSELFNEQKWKAIKKKIQDSDFAYVCWIGDVMENAEIHQQMLNLPRYVFPAAMLVFGYPTAQQRERPKPPRADMRHIVHENGYRDMDAQELKQMLTVKAGQRSFEEWIAAFCNRKYNSEFSREMTRSVQVFLEDYHS